MEITQLRYFLEVARQRHFSRAASVCHVSQPSLSQQIKKLESEVGGMLLERRREAVQLSPLGRDFLKHAQEIVARVDAAEAFVNNLRSDAQRTIRIGAIPTIAPFLVPELIRMVSAKNPALRIELVEDVTEALLEPLLTGQIDFALLSPPTRIDAECDRRRLLEDRFVIALPERHRLAGKGHLGVEQLRAEPVLQLEPAHCLAGQVGSYCDEIGLRAAVGLRSSQLDTLLGFVEKGLGIGIIPLIAAQAYEQRRVVFRRIDANACSRDVSLVWLRRQFLGATRDTLIDAANRLAAKLMARGPV